MAMAMDMDTNAISINITCFLMGILFILCVPIYHKIKARYVMVDPHTLTDNSIITFDEYANLVSNTDYFWLDNIIVKKDYQNIRNSIMDETRNYVFTSYHYYRLSTGNKYRKIRDVTDISYFSIKRYANLKFVPIYDESLILENSKHSHILSEIVKEPCLHAKGIFFFKDSINIIEFPIDSHVLLLSDDYAGDDYKDPDDINVISQYVDVYWIDRDIYGYIHYKHLSPITYDTNKFDRLTIESDQKQLLKMSSSKYLASPDHIRCMSIILYGPPGTSKTLGAKYLAEYLKIPMITINDNHIKAGIHHLEKIFNIAYTYKCMLVIDDADVFMAKRTTQGQEYEKTVNNLLNLINDHKGILVATTNHIDQIDSSFYSRFMLKLDFTINNYQHVWNQILEQNNIHLDDHDYQFPKIDKREIENVIQMALLDVLDDPANVTIEHLKTYIDVMKFNT